MLIYAVKGPARLKKLIHRVWRERGEVESGGVREAIGKLSLASSAQTVDMSQNCVQG